MPKTKRKRHPGHPPPRRHKQPRKRSSAVLFVIVVLVILYALTWVVGKGWPSVLKDYLRDSDRFVRVK